MVNKKIFFGRSLKDLAIALGPTALVVATGSLIIYKYVNPAPPKKIVISTGEAEGNYDFYAKLYKDILREDGIDLEIRPSSGARENLQRLQDRKSEVDAGFVQDGLGSSEEAPNLVSLGSLYYEPLWIFYRSRTELTHLAQLKGKKVAIGLHGGGTRILPWRLLKANGIDSKNTQFLETAWQDAAKALKEGKVDAVFFIATPDDPLIKQMLESPGFRLMNLDQAEAIARHFPYLHHLVLPHGAIDLEKNLPPQDIHLVSPTATLIVKEQLHPALIYLLLKAAMQVHSEPDILEKKGEFPIDKDYVFPLSEDAERYYKNGAPFWQRYLPFWLATLVNRFIIVILPLIAILFPMIKSIPRILEWRVKSRIYQRYGELKYLETQIIAHPEKGRHSEYLSKLDGIEQKVNQMKVPLDFSDHVYVLREHIHFVRNRLSHILE